MRTKRELRELLAEHRDWLWASSNGYDEGLVSEHKRIAVAIRTLVYDGPRSLSLLTQLGLRDSMNWSSAVPVSEGVFAGPPWIDRPDTPGFAPMRGEPLVETNFATWWTGALVELNAEKISRSWVVMHVANFDGGAHVDPELPSVYSSLARDGGLQPVRINSAGNRYPDGSDPLPSGLRTMCREVLVSIENADW